MRIAAGRSVSVCCGCRVCDHDIGMLHDKAATSTLLKSELLDSNGSYGMTSQ